jgi:hypothetical protein
MHQTERDHRHADDQRHRLHQAFQDEGQHGAYPFT